MDKINLSSLKRNPDVFKKYFKYVGDTIICNEDLKVIFPERYINKELVFMGSTTRIISIFAILDKYDNYCAVIAPIYQELAPFNITDAVVGDVMYKVLHFNKNDVFTISKTLVKTDGFIYDLFDEFIIKGNIPAFLSYDDISELLLESKKYAGNNVGNNMLIMEILTSIIARDKNDKTIFFRQVLEKESDKIKSPIDYIGLNNIYYSFDNTGARLVGGYFGSGVINAILNKEKETTVVSDLLRA